VSLVLSERVSAELLGSLLDEHGGALALYAAQWTENADDCVQEALLKLANQSSIPENPVAWMFRAVRNFAINQFRAARRRERREAMAERLRLRYAEVTRSTNDGDEGPSSTELVAALDSLPDEQKEVIIARIWGGLGFEQVAELAGCSTSTAHRRYEAGLSTLRQRLSQACQNH
jgi:RNA polymerase sigma factor (sigma-70 family)